LVRYLLDTNIISDLVRNPSGKAARRVQEVGADCICTSIVVAAELRYGWAKSGSERLRRQGELVLAAMDVLPLDIPADRAYGLVRAALEQSGQLIGPNDLLIAAHARALGAVVVTGNVGEFERVAGLVVENWLA
jgi:tRNA(fMet)-specific endonuclease VapC